MTRYGQNHGIDQENQEIQQEQQLDWVHRTAWTVFRGKWDYRQLSACRAKTYKLIRNLVNPRKPTDKSFIELVNLVKNHWILDHRPSCITSSLTAPFVSREKQYNSMNSSWLSARISAVCVRGSIRNPVDQKAFSPVGCQFLREISNHDGNCRQENTWSEEWKFEWETRWITS